MIARLFFAVALAALMISLVAGCKDAGTNPEIPPGKPPATNTTVSFSQNISPILNLWCTGCHPSNGGLNGVTVAQLLAGGLHGTAVVAGNADGSNLIKKLQAPPPFGSRMPLGGPYFADSTIAVIKIWINEGAHDN